MESAADTLSVTGREKITTEAGLFDAFVVDVKPSDGGREPEVLDHFDGPADRQERLRDPESMGGGIITTELAKYTCARALSLRAERRWKCSGPSCIA